MNIQRKALFNRLRLNWLLEPSTEAAEWQVEDYRALSSEELFRRLEQEEVRLDPASFVLAAQEFESPEDLTENLLVNADHDHSTEDQLYLVIFELWRRFLPEKTCLSIFCDELDYQIGLYDSGDLVNLEPLENVLSTLQAVLDENTDFGNNPQDVLKTVSTASANDIEDFLFDFISDQIDSSNYSYALELLDGFYHYVSDPKWFDLLRVRVLFDRDPQAANELLETIISDALQQDDLTFNLEILALMVLGGERRDLIEVAKKTISLIQDESDLKELIALCADYYQRLDYDWEEESLQALAKKHLSRPSDAHVSARELNSARAELLKILKKRPI